MRDLLEAFPKSAKTLRPHQDAAVNLIRQSFGKGNNTVVCTMPTGAGKTVTAADIIQKAQAKGNRVIFTAPAVSLIDQTVRAFEEQGICDIGVMQANHPRTDRLAGVQVASVQTLARREIPEASLIIVDEVHIRADVIDKLIVDRPDIRFIGLSATPWRRGMGLLWQDLVTPITIRELIDQGLLSQYAAYAPSVPNLSGVKVRAGEYVEAQLQEVMGEAKLMGHVVQNWLARGEDRPTLCFGVNCLHAKEMAAQFEKSGIASAYVDAFTDTVERELINRQFRNGEIRVICSVRTMTTGVDLPVSCIIDAAPTMSEMLHIQKIGRGLRVNPGTTDLVIFDHAGNLLRLGMPDEITYNELDKTPAGEKPKNGPKAEKLPSECGICSTMHTSLICPTCGNERKPVNKVEVAEGELAQISGKEKRATKEDKQLFWSMALWLDRDRRRGGKLAKGLYRGKFGVWPQGLRDEHKHPDRDFFNYEKSRRIAFAKSKGAKK